MDTNNPPLATNSRPIASGFFTRRCFYWLALLAGGGVAVWYLGWWAWGSYHYRAAQTHIQNRDFDKACTHLAYCRQAWPADGATWLLAARTLRRASRYAEVGELLDQAQRLGARPRDVKLERALLAAQQGRFAEVEKFLTEKLNAARPDFPLIAEVVSAEWMRTYRLADARALLTQWLQKEPADVEILIRRGWVAEHQLDFNAAIADYRQVLEKTPARAPVRLRLVENLLKLRQASEALPHAEELLAKQPTDAAVVLVAAQCWRDLGQRDKARSLLSALPGEPAKDPRILAERAQLALQAGDLEEAESLFRAALRQGPRERAVLYGLQQCLSRRGQAQEAKQLALVIQEVDADGRRMEEVLRALSLNPADADLRCEFGILFVRNGLTEDGLRWLHMALEMEPNHRRAHEFLAGYFEKQANHDRAAYHRQILQRLPVVAPAKAPT